MPTSIADMKREFPDGPMPSVSIVTKRGDSVKTNTLATTPQSGTGDVIVHPMPIWKRIAIRAAKSYLQSLVGFIGIYVAGTQLDQFSISLLDAVQLAVVPTVIGVITNLYIFFKKWDESLPELMA